MKVIDFMSRPPANKFAIFSQGRNKTNFGAVIFLIAIIAIIINVIMKQYVNISKKVIKIKIIQENIINSKLIILVL